MLRLLASILIAGGVFASTVVDSEALLERTGDHHEHGQLLDAHAGEQSHQHGDSDDHHNSPDSPCDHHVLHCCCGHFHVVIASPIVSNVSPENSQRVALVQTASQVGLFAV